MDAVKFIEERNRMCNSFGDKCNGCPASGVLCCTVSAVSKLDAMSQVALVKDWSDAHPRKTRQSEFLEQWPEAFLDDEYGILQFCPRYISAAYRNDDGKCKNPGKRCIDCSHEFWMQEVE